MKERPILFSGPMVRAILEGRKTQTRRVVKPIAVPIKGITGKRIGTEYVDIVRPECFKCPYGQPGDRLWVRETWGTRKVPDYYAMKAAIFYKADECLEGRGYMGWKPSIHMPRWASRITLEIVSVRVERLNLITRTDVLAEGIERHTKDGELYKYGIDGLWPWRDWENTHVRAYKKLWEAINGPESWDANPWVWVIEFKRVSQ